MKSLISTITEDSLITGLRWTRTHSRIHHEWEGETTHSDERTQDHLILSLSRAQRVWNEPVYTKRLTPERWSQARAGMDDPLQALHFPLVNLSPGPIPVIFTHGAGAVMAHELIGHPTEAQAWAEKLSPFSQSLNSTIAPPFLSVYDDPTRDHLVGSFSMDDEGYQARRAPILRQGKLIHILGDYLHSHLFPCEPGNGRVANYSHFPTARMSNTVIGPGEDIVDPSRIMGAKRLQILRLQGGSYSPDGMVTLAVRMGVVWEGSRPLGRVENTVLTGRLDHLLEGIMAVGADLHTCWSFGECTRGGQTLLVGAESPNLLLEGMVIL